MDKYLDPKVSELLSEISATLLRLEARMDRLVRAVPADDVLHFLEKLPEDPEPSVEWAGNIQGFLEAHQIKVLRSAEEMDEDKVLDRIALYMARQWKGIVPFIQKWKKNNGGKDSRKSISINLTHVSGPHRTELHNFLGMLKRIAFISDFTFKTEAESRAVVVHLNDHPEAINFLSGGWMERAVDEIVEDVLSHYRTDLFNQLEKMRSVEVQLPNGDPAELDVLYKIGGEMFWFECKTGSYQRHLPKYGRFARMMGLDNHHAFLVLAEADTQTVDDVSAMYGLTVLPITRFESTIKRFLLHLGQ